VLALESKRQHGYSFLHFPVVTGLRLALLTSRAMNQSNPTLADLRAFASTYQVSGDLPVRFDGRPYSRLPLHRDSQMEIVVICFADGQTSSVHDHEGCNCVVRVVRGKVLENLFTNDSDGTLQFESNQCLLPGDVSALDGRQIHQLINLDARGSVLLNFYSPPFNT
jgi:predicted metal-dependent enzyme (double-stranded beta helix superfamily)